MAKSDNPIKVCNCNRTMALDGAALGRALDARGPLEVHTELCRKEIGDFVAALKGDACVVACTQEAPLFGEVARAQGSTLPIRFVNIREAAGWSAEGREATAKIAALLATANLPEPEPVASVSYRSGGQLLIIGPAAAAVAWAERLANDLDVGVLATDTRHGELPSERRYPVWSGRVVSIQGYLGQFDVGWEQTNPIDLEVCTRCNACIRACPEQAIDFTYQIDLDRCRAHRACVKTCGEVRAIDFERADRARTERFDMVMDLSAEPLLKVPQKPQGYLAPGADPLEQALAATALARLVGEFEKPRFFAYDERICAHARSGKVGCTNCIDVCSTGAIRPEGNGVVVEPHLCAGCGGCATVCPSGAMTHVYPRVGDLGLRLKRLLSVYRAAGGRQAAILFHSGATRALIHKLARAGKGLPARVIPLEVHHAASVGIDVALGALAYGASQVLWLASGDEAGEYGAAIERQFGYAQAIVSALGYEGEHFRLIGEDAVPALERALWALSAAGGVDTAGTFNLGSEKRTTLEFAIEHLARHARHPQTVIPLASGAPFGGIDVNKETCTLCKACIGACPASALLDSPEALELRFIERNCVQCGLCERTCPEDAIRLVPRLTLGAAAKQPVVLNVAEPFHCVRCGTAFGTRRMIDNMTGRLGAHSMFAGGGALRRLQMCADCRVVDMMESKDEPSILDPGR